jgi:hypothetical protein
MSHRALFSLFGCVLAAGMVVSGGVGFVAGLITGRAYFASASPAPAADPDRSPVRPLPPPGLLHKPPPELAKPEPVDRDVFRQLIGTGVDDLKEAAGTPDRTEEPEWGTSFWHYYKQTRDPGTGRVDSDAVLTIHNGTVAAVNFR